MPRSEICSPNHMMNAVPVVRVSTVISRKDQPGWETMAIPLGLCAFSSAKPIAKDWITLKMTVPYRVY